MHYNFFVLLASMTLSILSPFCSAQSLLLGKELAHCQENTKEYSFYIKCLETKLAESEARMDNIFHQSLSVVQSEEWLSANVDYQDITSPVTVGNKEKLLQEQDYWLKHRNLFCDLADSQISVSAQNHYPLLVQCKINLTNKRVSDLKFFIAQDN